MWDTPGPARTPAPVANVIATSDWLEDLLQKGGKSAQERNPNASLRISIPAPAKAAPVVVVANMGMPHR